MTFRKGNIKLNCKKCGITIFGKRKSKKFCEDCKNKKRKAYWLDYIKKPGVKERKEEYDKKYRLEHNHKIKQKTYYKNFLSKNKKYQTKYHRKRKNKDPLYHILMNLRNSLYLAIKQYAKTGKTWTSKKYGIDYKAIINHLKPFPKDISKYHIDHIIPLNLFDFNNLKQIKKAFAPENHQWLTIQENLEKNNRLVMPHYSKPKNK